MPGSSTRSALAVTRLLSEATDGFATPCRLYNLWAAFTDAWAVPWEREERDHHEMCSAVTEKIRRGGPGSERPQDSLELNGSQGGVPVKP